MKNKKQYNTLTDEQMKNMIENFENGLLQRGISYEVLEKHKQEIGHWFYETEDMTIEEFGNVKLNN